ncbi:MAG: hypothetical protein BJ554DRAFT_5890 [Olpidium bornovanus]|uniref:MPN domain-containing protein n=1 Tax=Olpidium bornovanus TaxID=278681 RepID=A0A8H8DKN4_9FUNG|nr:MAG: hypothetical protein BJ554DRAFT_5890 [Olpidium bornovanus]
MDPEAADAVRAEIEERGLGVVGWYHSHPFFSPDPSNIDLVNQNNYQRLTRDDLGFAPFVGAIVSKLPE